MSDIAGTETYSIVVDGQLKTVSSRDVTWAQVVDIACPVQRENPDMTFVVTYSQAEQAHHEGLLPEGGSVHVKKEGTVFNVAARRRS